MSGSAKAGTKAFDQLSVCSLLSQNSTLGINFGSDAGKDSRAGRTESGPRAVGERDEDDCAGAVWAD